MAKEVKCPKCGRILFTKRQDSRFYGKLSSSTSATIEALGKLFNES